MNQPKQDLEVRIELQVLGLVLQLSLPALWDNKMPSRKLVWFAMCRYRVRRLFQKLTQN
jgi:hypothetical protein